MIAKNIQFDFPVHGPSGKLVPVLVSIVPPHLTLLRGCKQDHADFATPVVVWDMVYLWGLGAAEKKCSDVARSFIIAFHSSFGILIPSLSSFYP